MDLDREYCPRFYLRGGGRPLNPHTIYYICRIHMECSQMLAETPELLNILIETEEVNALSDVFC